MKELTQFQQGQLAFKQGVSYKGSSNTQWINGWTNEERMTNCGFTYETWNRSGKVRTSADMTTLFV